MTRQHPIEPELNTPTPREVSYREGFRPGCGAWATRLALIPHTVAGVVILLLALNATGLYLRVGLFGVECDGRVVHKTAYKGGKGGWHYEFTYAYTLDQVQHTERVMVNADAYGQFSEGDPVAVRALESEPERDPWVRVPGHNAVQEVLGAWFMALFWNGIMCLFLWPLYGRPRRHRRLVRLGQPVGGVIREVRERNTKPRSWKVTYEYPVPDPDGLGEVQQTSSMVLDKLPAVTAGTPVTVLYDPNKPKRSVVYGLTNYRAV